MAPKTLPSASKQAAVLGFFHTSGVAHSLKDLEKELPKQAGVSSMQVKDLLQALSDDNKIHVEKIGSGNWYWSFVNEHGQELERQLARAIEERDKSQNLVQELENAADLAVKEREDEDCEALSGPSRGDLLESRLQLGVNLQDLDRALATYCDNDPVELLQRQKISKQLQEQAMVLTDQILAMEGYLKTALGGDKAALRDFKRNTYGDHFDEDEEELREL